MHNSNAAKLRLLNPGNEGWLCHDWQVPLNPKIDALNAPTSPCINVCTLDAQGFCVGCLRTGAEIGRWMAMSAAEKWQLLRELAERRERRATQGGALDNPSCGPD